MPWFRWFAVALKFVYKTMPVDHPLKTGFATLAYNMERAQQEAEGQGYRTFGQALIGKAEKGTMVAPWQQGGINIGGGKTYSGQYYGPQGAVGEGIFGAASEVAPWATAITEGLEKLREPKTQKGALSSIAEGIFPPARYGTELLEGKPAGQVFDPLRIEPRKISGETKKKKGALTSLPKLPTLPKLPEL